MKLLFILLLMSLQTFVFSQSVNIIPGNDHCRSKTIKIFSATAECIDVGTTHCPGPPAGQAHSVTGGSFSSNSNSSNWKGIVTSDSGNYNSVRKCFGLGQTINMNSEFNINIPCNYCDEKYKIGQFSDDNNSVNQPTLDNINTNVFTYLFKNGQLHKSDFPIEILTKIQSNFEYQSSLLKKIQNIHYNYYCSPPPTSPVVTDQDEYNYCFSLDRECKASIKINLGDIDLNRTSTIRSFFGFDPIYDFVFIIIDEDHDVDFENNLSLLLDTTSSCTLPNNNFTLENLKILNSQACGHLSQHIEITTIPTCHMLNISRAKKAKFEGLN